MDERELRQRLQRAAARIVVPDHPLRTTARRASRAPVALAALTLALIAIVVTQLPAIERGGVAASPLATASPSASTGSTSIPTLDLVTFESTNLEYRATLPAGVRRSDCLSGPAGAAPVVATDVFTALSPDQERALDRSHTARGGAPVAWTISVALWSSAGLSPLGVAQRGGCAACPPEVRTGERIEQLTLNGYDAARILVTGEPRLYAVQFGARMYVLELFSIEGGPPRPAALPTGVLASVAESLRASSAPPPVVASPGPPVVGDAARATAQRVAAALSSGDVDTIAAFMVPRCWFETRAANVGPLGRAIGPYLVELRARFATGGLRVRADPSLNVASVDGPAALRVFLRSQWTESGQTVPVDLYLREVDGRWYWGGTLTGAPQ